MGARELYQDKTTPSLQAHIEAVLAGIELPERDATIEGEHLRIWLPFHLFQIVTPLTITTYLEEESA